MLIDNFLMVTTRARGRLGLSLSKIKRTVCSRSQHSGLRRNSSANAFVESHKDLSWAAPTRLRKARLRLRRLVCLVLCLILANILVLVALFAAESQWLSQYAQSVQVRTESAVIFMDSWPQMQCANDSCTSEGNRVLVQVFDLCYGTYLGCGC